LKPTISPPAPERCGGWKWHSRFFMQRTKGTKDQRSDLLSLWFWL
jgi:hypothetical protein